jgi:hypothetical protein
MPDVESDPVADEAYSSSSERRHDETATEAGQSNRVNGYHRIAELFAAVSSLAIVRKFGQLHSLNLLCLQAELVELEDDLKAYAHRGDISPDSIRRIYRCAWARLSNGDTDPDAQDKNRHQWQTLLRIRSALKDYSKFGIALVHDY